jgi:hypothetical protein
MASAGSGFEGLPSVYNTEPMLPALPLISCQTPTAPSLARHSFSRVAFRAKHLMIV